MCTTTFLAPVRNGLLDDDGLFSLSVFPTSLGPTSMSPDDKIPNANYGAIVRTPLRAVRLFVSSSLCSFL